MRKRLRDAGLLSYKAARKFYLNAKLAKKRLDFCQKVKNWTLEHWKKVLWSDESSFKVFDRKVEVLVRRKVGERYEKKCVKTSVQGGGGSVMVWGCFGYPGIGELFFCQGNVKKEQYLQILNTAMLPSAERLYSGYCRFQQDNAPIHTAHVVTEWFKDKGIIPLDWPARSPDLNLIENLWSILDRHLAKNPPRGLDDLKVKLKEAWVSVPAETLQNLVHDMPRRIEACIKAKGWYFKA